MSKVLVLALFLLVSGMTLLPASKAAEPQPPTPAAVDSIMVLNDDARYAEAESLGWALIQELEEAHGPESYEVARTLDAYLESRWRQRGADLGERELSLAERAIAIKRELLGPDHPEVARSLGTKASVLVAQRDLEGSIAVRKEALAILRKSPDTDPVILASALSNIGINYGMLARFEEATPYLVESLEVYTQALGENHLDVAAAAHNVGNVYYVRADYEKAREYYQRGLSSLEASVAPDHPRIMVSLYSLGTVCRVRGDYAGAREYYRRGLELGEQRDGPESPELIRNLRGLGGVENMLGDNEEALALYRRALDIGKKNYPPDSIDMWAEWFNVGYCLRALGRNEEARPYLTRAIQIVNERSPEHNDLVYPLAELAMVEKAEGNNAAAVDTLSRALEVAKKVLGPTNNETGDVHAYLAAVYEGMGDHQAAAPHLEGAIAAYESDWRDRQNYARVLLQRSRVRLDSGDHDAAYADALRGEENGREHFVSTVRTLSEREAFDFSAFRGNGIPLMLSILIRNKATEDKRLMETWDAVIRSRSLLLDEIAERYRLARETENPELADLARTVLDARTRLANLYLEGPQGEDPALFTARLETLSRAKEEAEARLAERSAGFRTESESRRAGVQEVSGGIPEGAALVAYVRYPRRVAGQDPVDSYAALVMTSREKSPALIDLGEAAKIDERVAAWREAVAGSAVPSGPLARSAEERVLDRGAELRAVILDPLDEHLAQADPVFLVPDGSLHLINPAALPSPDRESYLVETGPLFHILPSERALLSGDPVGPGEGLLALGGPEFGSPLPPTSRPKDLYTADAVNVPQRGAGPECDQFLELEFPVLPGAREEAREVATIWDETGFGTARLLLGSDATETAFKNGLGDRSVLHLATHGYFLESDCALRGGERSGSGEALFDIVRGNPLLLSGLALAGSNQRWNKAAPENGVLTAEEISALDLDHVRWVVLSACDTGRGELLGGEGIYGLQRAFQTAGAHTVIMSLWAVDDQATRTWMRSLYHERWRENASTAQAVRRASLEMLRELREGGLATSPATWGAFVASGDWK